LVNLEALGLPQHEPNGSKDLQIHLFETKMDFGRTVDRLEKRG
jgi:hypothetical protein